MDRKKSVGITIIGIAEIIFGFLGTLAFICGTYMLIGNFLYILRTNQFHTRGIWQSEAFFGGGIGIICMVLSLPLLFILTAGIGVLKLKAWGRKLSLIGAMVAILIISYLISAHAYERISWNNKLKESKVALNRMNNENIDQGSREYKSILYQNKRYNLEAENYRNALILDISLGFIFVAMFWFFTRAKIKAQFNKK